MASSSADASDVWPDLDLETIEADLQQFRDDDVVRDALGKGVDLRQYARQVDEDLRALLLSSVPAYIDESPHCAALYKELNECDAILAKMESAMESWQSDLGGISDQIKHLQAESHAMSVKVRNRKLVERELAVVLDKLLVSDHLIVGICSGEVNDEWVELVRELDDKLRFVRSQEPLGASRMAPCETLAAREVEPQLDRLRLKAVAKSRLFLLQQFANLKKPKTNVQILQQNVLLRYRYLQQFLSAHAPAVAEEVRAVYVDTMSRVLHGLFKSYTQSLGKLAQAGPPKEDVVGAEEAWLLQNQGHPALAASLFTPFACDVAGPSGAGAALLAARQREQGEPQAAPVIVHVAKSANAKLHFEAVFRSVQKHLMDSASSEFLFLLEFFEARLCGELFNQIFARTLSLCLEAWENFLYGCNDCVALLLMIRTSQAHRVVMERRRVPALDGYFDHVNMLLWPQFKKVFDAQLRSLAQAQPAKLGAARLDLRPHYVAQRYAEFASTVYALSTSLSASDEMLPLQLAKLRESLAALLDQLVQAALLSKVHHRALDSPKGRLVFRINNVDWVLECLHDAAHSDDLAFFKARLARDTALYIEEELQQAFGPMLAFFKAAEEGGGKAAEATSALPPAAPAVQEFALSWKSGLEQLSATIATYFVRKGNARDILKQLLSQFILYYTRFQEAVRVAEPKAAQRLVPLQEIMSEMKNLSRAA
jgi:hypothetical protein